MKLKKILAAFSATAVAATMAVSASAAITSSIPDSADDGSGNFQIFLKGEGAVSGEFADVDITKIAAFDVTFSWEDGDDVWAGGAIVVQSDYFGWNSFGEWTKGEDANKAFDNVEPGKPVHVVMDDSFDADDGYACITIQSYGVDITVDAITLYDADGNVLYGADAAPAEPTEPSEQPTEPTEPSEPDNSGNTGLAGVALVGVALAGASVVASKKRR